METSVVFLLDLDAVALNAAVCITVPNEVGTQHFAGQHVVGRDLLRVGLNRGAALGGDLLPAVDRLAGDSAHISDFRQ